MNFKYMKLTKYLAYTNIHDKPNLRFLDFVTQNLYIKRFCQEMKGFLPVLVKQRSFHACILYFCLHFVDPY